MIGVELQNRLGPARSSSREKLYKHTENNKAKNEFAFGLGESERQRIGAATSENYLYNTEYAKQLK